MAEDSIPNLSRPQMYLFGCSLKADKKEYKVEVDDDDAEHQLSLKAVCLGADAEDKFHTVEIEGMTYEGKSTKFPLVVLKPSVLPSVSLGGFEVTPPVCFRLQSGSGPVYISGQHFVSVKDSDDEEEEHNTSPVKRPSHISARNAPLKKKLKMDSDVDDSEDDEDDSDDDEDDDEDDEDVKPAKTSTLKSPKKSKVPQEKRPKSSLKQNGPAGKAHASKASAGGGKDKASPGPSSSSSSAKGLSMSEVKSKLTAAVKEGKPLPKSEQKFENFAKSAFKISDKQVVKDLWKFMQTLRPDKK
ncbi:nucleophosmin 1b isoform X1 [Engraulis encrasicolus]|uniref:nucleophosmin 1b isoform X1 n=1 Tax=Engraulis encrasicolus TaxID=184585 RepID=UPI002FD3DC24